MEGYSMLPLSLHRNIQRYILASVVKMDTSLRLGCEYFWLPYMVGRGLQPT